MYWYLLYLLLPIAIIFTHTFRVPVSLINTMQVFTYSKYIENSPTGEKILGCDSCLFRLLFALHWAFCPDCPVLLLRGGDWAWVVFLAAKTIILPCVLFINHHIFPWWWAFWPNIAFWKRLLLIVSPAFWPCLTEKKWQKDHYNPW